MEGPWQGSNQYLTTWAGHGHSLMPSNEQMDNMYILPSILRGGGSMYYAKIYGDGFGDLMHTYLRGKTCKD
eukprot:1289315-Pyramimonas_sp.AAC.1